MCNKLVINGKCGQGVSKAVGSDASRLIASHSDRCDCAQLGALSVRVYFGLSRDFHPDCRFVPSDRVFGAQISPGHSVYHINAAVRSAHHACTSAAAVRFERGPPQRAIRWQLHRQLRCTFHRLQPLF